MCTSFISAVRYPCSLAGSKVGLKLSLVRVSYALLTMTSQPYALRRVQWLWNNCSVCPSCSLLVIKPWEVVCICRSWES